MSINDTDRDRLSRLSNSVLDDVINMSEKELNYSMKEAGLVPESEVEKIKESITKLIGDNNSTLLESTRKALSNKEKNIDGIKLPESIDKCRKLFRKIISNADDLPEELTLQFRDGSMPSDDDIQTILEDFYELGLIKESDINNIDND